MKLITANNDVPIKIIQTNPTKKKKKYIQGNITKSAYRNFILLVGLINFPIVNKTDEIDNFKEKLPC